MIQCFFTFSATVTSLSENILSPNGFPSSMTSHQNEQKLLRASSENSASSKSDGENGVVLRQNAKNQIEQNNNDCQKEMFSPSMEINRLQIAPDFNQESMLQQPRNRLGLLLTPTVELPSPFNESTTPAQTPIQSNCKRDSPFYAEPADALAGNVVRRSQRGNAPPKSQRHSEPPKTQSRSKPFCQVLSPIDSEKSHHISGSLDELKKKPRAKPVRSGRLDPWPVDSSWEFMGNDDQNDYDTDANWKPQMPIQNGGQTEDSKQSPNLSAIRANSKEHRLTINQVIAQKFPDLKILELLQKFTIPASSSIDSYRNDGTMTSFGKCSRLSAYDNVERGGGYATSLIYHGSGHSDDGTVFSEPWDSSQWDSFLPHDGMFQ